jgi:hypothetical protein
VIKIKDYVALVKHKGDLEETLKKAINLICCLGTIESPVIIKPNICADYDRTGYAITNVNIVEALRRIIHKAERSIPVKIVESDSESK